MRKSDNRFLTLRTFHREIQLWPANKLMVLLKQQTIQGSFSADLQPGSGYICGQLNRAESSLLVRCYYSDLLDIFSHDLPSQDALASAKAGKKWSDCISGSQRFVGQSQL